MISSENLENDSLASYRNRALIVGVKASPRGNRVASIEFMRASRGNPSTFVVCTFVSCTLSGVTPNIEIS